MESIGMSRVELRQNDAMKRQQVLSFSLDMQRAKHILGILILNFLILLGGCKNISAFQKLSLELLIAETCYRGVFSLWGFTRWFWVKRGPHSPHLGVEPKTFGLEVRRAIHCANGTYEAELIKSRF